MSPVTHVGDAWRKIFGEDPYLTGQLGLAYVEGMQGDSLNTDHTVIAGAETFRRPRQSRRRTQYVARPRR